MSPPITNSFYRIILCLCPGSKSKAKLKLSMQIKTFVCRSIKHSFGIYNYFYACIATLNALLKIEGYEVSPFEDDFFIGPKNQVIRQIVPSPAKLIIVFVHFPLSLLGCSSDESIVSQSALR